MKKINKLIFFLSILILYVWLLIFHFSEVVSIILSGPSNSGLPRIDGSGTTAGLLTVLMFIWAAFFIWTPLANSNKTMLYLAWFIYLMPILITVLYMLAS
jgi:hypothetical protein